MNGTVWYKSFWKILLLVVVVFILGGGLLFGWMVYQEYQKIQSGQVSQFSNTQFLNNGQLSGDANGTTQNIQFIPDVDDDPYLGNLKAPVVIISFEDFQCPFCKEAYVIMQSILKQYPDDVVFVYRDFPLTNIHLQSFSAALAANCAAEQGKFWLYHDMLFANQASLTTTTIFSQLAQQAGLNTTDFATCLDNQTYTAEVQKDLDEGLLAGVSATPTYFVNGTMYRGVLSEDQWKAVIEAELAKTK